MDYSFKRGFKPDMKIIRKALEEEFPTEIIEEEGKLSFSFGALKSIQVSISGKKLSVITESESSAGDDLVLDTNKRFEIFWKKLLGTIQSKGSRWPKEASKGD